MKYNRIDIKDLLNDQLARDGSTKTGSSNVCEISRCDLDGCIREFASPKALSIHQKRVHSAPTKFACKLCPATLSSAPNLAKHVSNERATILTQMQESVPIRDLKLTNGQMYF